MTTTATRPTSTRAVSALRVLSVLTVLSLAWQFVTAGQLFPDEGPEELHAGGAIVLHVVSGLTALAAAWVWRQGAPLWPALLAALVFVLTFVQAADGGRSTLWIHVPGAFVLTVGAVWVATWSLTHGRRSRASQDR